MICKKLVLLLPPPVATSRLGDCERPRVAVCFFIRNAWPSNKARAEAASVGKTPFGNKVEEEEEVTLYAKQVGELAAS